MNSYMGESRKHDLVFLKQVSGILLWQAGIITLISIPPSKYN